MNNPNSKPGDDPGKPSDDAPEPSLKNELSHAKDQLGEELNEIWANVKLSRDELGSQLDLIKKDLETDLLKIEDQYQTYKHHLAILIKSSDQINTEVLESAKDLGKEVLASYKRIREIIEK